MKISWTKDGNSSSWDLPKLTFGNTTYTPEKHLGTGGFGQVFEYRAKNRRAIAVKFAKDPTNLTEQTNACTEARLHAQAAQNGHPNVLGFTGVVQSQHFGVGVAIELAPHGDVYDMATKISQNLKAGLITHETARALRLTLCKDVIAGVAEILEQGIMHNDIKEPNAFISAGGTAMIADFGSAIEADEGKDVRFINIPLSDNPRWVSPELLFAREKQDNIRKLKDASVTKKLNSSQDSLKSSLGKMQDKTLKSLSRSIMLPTIRRNERALVVNSKADSWSLGIAVNGIMTGEMFMPNDDTLEIERRIKAFASDPANVAIPTVGVTGNKSDKALLPTTGDDDLDAVINGLLHPDPQQRLTPKQALQAPIFAVPEVGSKKSRDLLIAVSTGNQAALSNADIYDIDEIASTIREMPIQSDSRRPTIAPTTTATTTTTGISTTSTTTPSPSLGGSQASQASPSAIKPPRADMPTNDRLPEEQPLSPSTSDASHDDSSSLTDKPQFERSEE